MQERDAVVERWLREEVVQVYDAMQTTPDRAVTLDQVAADLLAHHVDRLRSNKRGA